MHIRTRAPVCCCDGFRACIMLFMLCVFLEGQYLNLVPAATVLHVNSQKWSAQFTHQSDEIKSEVTESRRKTDG